MQLATLHAHKFTTFVRLYITWLDNCTQLTKTIITQTVKTDDNIEPQTQNTDDDRQLSALGNTTHTNFYHFTKQSAWLAAFKMEGWLIAQLQNNPWCWLFVQSGRTSTLFDKTNHDNANNNDKNHGNNNNNNDNNSNNNNNNNDDDNNNNNDNNNDNNPNKKNKIIILIITSMLIKQ